MAAAALSRSRGVAGDSTTKGLFFVFTLLCLVCFSSSLIDKEQVQKLVETYHSAQHNLDRVKAEYMSKMTTISEQMKKNTDLVDAVKALMKKQMSASPGDFPPVDKYLESIQDYMEKTKAEVDSENEALLAEIKHIEKDLGKMKKVVEALQEYQAEL